jgi:hypothetical protein
MSDKKAKKKEDSCCSEQELKKVAEVIRIFADKIEKGKCCKDKECC